MLSGTGKVTQVLFTMLSGNEQWKFDSKIFVLSSELSRQAQHIVYQE